MQAADGPGSALIWECQQLLYWEADVLDARRYEEWFGFLTEDIDYRIPVRATRSDSPEAEFCDHSFHVRDNYGTLRMRIDRLASGHAFSDTPPPRTLRQVGNVRVIAQPGPDEVEVSSKLLLYRAQGQQQDGDLLGATRRDVLRRVSGRWYLARRLVLLVHTTITATNLGSLF